MSLAVDIVKALVFGVSEEQPAPLPSIEVAEWKRFAKAFVNPANAVTETFRYGLFQLSVKRMCDLGLMTNPQPISTKSGRLVWSAQWVEPLSLRSFLADPARQYQAFCDSMRDYANAETVVQSIGREVDGRRATLSGLLAVAHRAGTQGLESWIESPAERLEFSHTTALFENVNGLF